jgi:hypothetical protein
MSTEFQIREVLQPLVLGGENLLSRLDPTHEWGSETEVTLYLDRCQVDTPDAVVQRVWKEVLLRRKKISKVVDFGAGDGRFAHYGRFTSYTGVEIDGQRCLAAVLPNNAKLIHSCAFNLTISDADLCVGNPPYVRNQDLPLGWRQKACKILEDRSGVVLSGLANAWQYFFLLSLISAKSDGMVALVIPYEWVSRPSARAIRAFIREKGWDVDVFRLLDESFDRVLTTSSITIVDKRKKTGLRRYFEQTADGSFNMLPSFTSGRTGFVDYFKKKPGTNLAVKARRGLSPGTQKVFTLSEAERARLGLQIDRDVVPCVTSLRHLPSQDLQLDNATFQRYYIKAGKKCWLLQSQDKPSSRLQAYIDSVPTAERATSTCTERDEWWRFAMPSIPQVLVATGFRGLHTKAVANIVQARAVGGVAGIYGVKRTIRRQLVESLVKARLGDRVVSHSHGLRKLEINQLNSVIQDIQERRDNVHG